MKTFIFDFETSGRQTYSVQAKNKEEAVKLLIEAENNDDKKYLVESEGESWNLDAWSRKSFEEKVADCIVDEFDD